jgi:hypothetical protein
MGNAQGASVVATAQSAANYVFGPAEALVIAF